MGVVFSVYLLTNLINGYFYIGCAQDVQKRWNYGLGYKTNDKFFNDIRKYGWNSIQKEILFSTDDPKIASSVEQFLIRTAKRVNSRICYNLSFIPYEGYDETTALKALAAEDSNSPLRRFYRELERPEEEDLEDFKNFWEIDEENDL